MDNLQALAGVHEDERRLLLGVREQMAGLRATLFGAFGTQNLAERAAQNIQEVSAKGKECIPRMMGASNDTTSYVRCSLLGAAGVEVAGRRTVAGLAAATEKATELLREELESRTQFELLAGIGKDYEKLGATQSLMQLIRQEPARHAELYTRHEALRHQQMRYRATLAEGQRLPQELIRLRREAAASLERFRYRDMAHRVFRNEALSQYPVIPAAVGELAMRYSHPMILALLGLLATPCGFAGTPAPDPFGRWSPALETPAPSLAQSREQRERLRRRLCQLQRQREQLDAAQTRELWEMQTAREREIQALEAAYQDTARATDDPESKALLDNEQQETLEQTERNLRSRTEQIEEQYRLRQDETMTRHRLEAQDLEREIQDTESQLGPRGG